jgi:hypothetical protein
LDPKVSKEIGGLDPGIEEPTSITRFLTLPTVTRQRHIRIRDPIFYFAQSNFLTLDQYTIVVEQLKITKEMTQRMKEQHRIDRQDSKRRKEVECEEGRAAKAAAWEEAARLKELRATQQVEQRATRQVKRDEAQHICAERMAEVAAFKATKAAEKASKTVERQDQQRIRAVRRQRWHMDVKLLGRAWTP